MSQFPPVGMVAKPDTAKMSLGVTNPAFSVETDAGVVFTRKRFTMPPKRQFSIGFTNISEADKELLYDFWDEYRGSSSPFTYTDWMTGVQYTVRFNSVPVFRYQGRGAYRRWDVDGIVLEQV